jgi:predicted nucleotidyltransferase
MLPNARIHRLAEMVADHIHDTLGPESRVIWFGSWVKGNARASSDIDLAISVPGGISPADYARLVTWLDEEAPTLYSFDLVNLDEVETKEKACE